MCRIPKNKQDYFNVAIKNMNWEDLLHNTDSEIASQIFTEKLQSTITFFSVKMKCRYKIQSLASVNDKHSCAEGGIQKCPSRTNSNDIVVYKTKCI